jgi:hypothetical protein
MKIPLYLVFVFISLLASLTIYFQKLKLNYLKVFPVFLFITILVELTGQLLKMLGLRNVLLYNFFTVFEFEVYLIILYMIIRSSNAKKIILAFIWIYPILSVLNILYFQAGTFHTFTYSIGCLLIVGFCIYFFLELFKYPRFINLIKEPAFWICSGLLFFYCCSFPLLGLINYLYSASSVILENLTSILAILNVLLYSLFTIAFLCKVKFRKRYLPQ